MTEPSHALQAPVSDLPSAKPSFDDDFKGRDGVGIGGGGGMGGGLGFEVSRAKTHMEIEDHSDVSPEEGAILIPCDELPENWYNAPDLDSINHLDRGFVFPGEQLHILVYISSHDQEAAEIITPFKVAAVMSKNGFFKQKYSKKKGNLEPETQSAAYGENADEVGTENGGVEAAGENVASALKNQPEIQGDFSFSASLLKMEGHKKRSAIILESFRNSHFFVRIAKLDEPLWHKRTVSDPFSESSEFVDGKESADRLEVPKTSQRHNCIPAVLEGGKFDPSSAGGVARNAVQCCSLSNGDVVVELQVTVATDITEDVILEVLQFEKYQSSNLGLTTSVGGISSQLHQENVKDLQDPCKELLQWLLPLDRPLPPPVPLSPPSLAISSSFYGNSSHRSHSSASSASNFFSFGHYRSNSTSSLPQGIQYPAPSLPLSNSSPNFDLENWDRLASQKVVKAQEVGSEGLLSFRGASLEPQRFSVHCGLEGLYVPGKRWRRKLEIVQPVEVDSYFADCNSEDLICVLIKNVVPAHLADVIIFVDSISIICEAAASGSPPVSVPIACIEVGDEHSLPGLPLRRGEQHSLILKAITSMWKSTGIGREKNPPGAQVRNSNVPVNSASSRNAFPRNREVKRGSVERDQQESGQYAILVSCRCSHTESKIYFKHSTQWQPRTPRDLLISVESEMSTAIRSDGSLPQLSAQVLTLQATNLTADDLSLTVLAPCSMASLPCVVSMNSTPTTPSMNSFMSFSEGKGRSGTLDTEDSGMTTMARLQSTSLPSLRPIENITGITPLALKEQNISAADIMADSSSACTHLWLQSTVPLGYVPSHSTTTVKLELLPLTDGIITLDTLQIAAKDRGIIYVPEKPLKIFSTSSIASSII
ncbi:hypothetical protein SUGI_1076840 [Cryptomeria japonica]|nr:uncharacterized protein LOC131040458 isoform X2 [Cryptomeria japonica]GLJ50540.1 hypothetical protein SUGI_1076840 [Cryptomeria japonica]